MLETKAVAAVPGREDERPVDRLNEFITAFIRMAPDLPPWIPPPLEPADARWLGGDEGMGCVFYLAKFPGTNARDLLYFVSKILAQVNSNNSARDTRIGYFRRRLGRFVQAGIFREATGWRGVKLYYINPRLLELFDLSRGHVDRLLVQLDAEKAKKVQKMASLEREQAANRRDLDEIERQRKEILEMLK